MHNVTMAPTRVVPSSVCGPPTTRTTYVRPKLPNLPGAQALAAGNTLPSPLPSQCTVEEARANALGENLRRWVEDRGGYIHPALQLSFRTPHGRGIVAADNISLRTAQQQPLIAVPERLLMTCEVAARQLGQVVQRERPERRWWMPRKQQQQQLPDSTLLLALLVASERAKGKSSAWAPYIASLPDDAPCVCALDQQQLDAELAQLGSMANGWAPKVQAAAAGVQRTAEAAAAAWGAELGLTAADVRWGLGQVMSRSYGSGLDLAMLPFLDCCNHRQHAGRPTGYTSRSGEPCTAVYGQHRGAAQALTAGSEVCVSYVVGASPLNMLLNFGFVPSEVLRAGCDDAAHASAGRPL